MTFRYKTIQKFVSFLIIISMLTPAIFTTFQPKKAEAWGIVWDPIHTTVTTKLVVQEIFKQFLMLAARNLLNKMTQQTISWINSGFHGNPLYLERPESFFKDIAKFEVRNLVNLFGYDSLRYPFGKDFSLNIINSYQRQLEDNASYSLSKVIDDPALLESYRNDFNVGGWNGFLINTQYPQNNYIGFQMLATEEAARRLQGTVQNAAQKVQTTLQQGMGFLSPQTCPSNPKYNNGKNEFLQAGWDEADYAKKNPYNNPVIPGSPGYSYEKYKEYDKQWFSDKQDAKAAFINDNTCPGGLVSTTPGSVVANRIMDTLGSSERRGELAQALGNSVAAILDTLMNHFLQMGLNALTNKLDSQGKPLIPPDDETSLDDFTYFGDTVRNAGTNNVPEPNFDPMPVTIVPGSGTSGGQCDATGNLYEGGLRDAIDAVLTRNSGGIADKPNLEDANGFKTNGKAFMILVAEELQNNGFRATAEVLNGNNNPNKGEDVGIWKSGDSMMERYEALAGGGSDPGSAKKIRDSISIEFSGFIPLACTPSGGSKECGCKTTTEEETPPNTEPGPSCNTCAEKGQTDKYQTDVRNAANEYLAAHPEIANLDSYNDSNGGVAKLRDGVISILKGRGFNATTSGNPPYAQVVNVWKSVDPDMTGYRVAAGGGPISQAIPAGYCGGHETFAGVDIIPNSCGFTSPSPGSKAVITSISPTTATAGTTTITINGTNLTNQVSFYDGNGGRNTVAGTVNNAKTQTTVLVPASQPSGNATVKIYQGSQTWSNGILISINGGGSAVATEPSVDATGGWGGSLAYNPTMNNWLVVSGGVNGRIMGNDRVPVTSEFTINSSTAYGGAKVVYASDINKYLVVWIGFPEAVGGTIYGRFVNPDGSMSGGQFVVFKDPPGGFSFMYSSSRLQYDSKNKKFVFVWEYRHPGVDSNLITISQSGVPGPVIDVGSGEGSWAPVLAVNETANEYCIAYVRDNGTTNVTRTYNPATGTLGAETSYDNNSLGVSSIVYNSVNKKYLIAWPAKSTTATNGRILNSCRITDGGSILTLNSAGKAASLAYNPKSNNYATIVQNQADFGNTYNILSSTGAKIKQGIAFAGSRNGSGGNFYPIIAPNLNDGTFAATSAIDYSPTRFTSNLGTATVGTTTTPTSIPGPASCPIVIVDGEAQHVCSTPMNL